MKKLRYLWSIPLVILMISSSYATSLSDLRITLLEGDVQIKTAESGEWMPASINIPLREDDMLWVPEDGRMEMQSRNGTSVRLDRNSSLQVMRLDDDSAQFYLVEGDIYVYSNGHANDVVQIDSDLSSTRGYERSIFRINVNTYGDNEVSVLRGRVYTENTNGQTVVNENQSLYMRGDDYAELGPLGPPDEWEKWNKERNRKIYEARYKSDYLPDELKVYSRDLDENGRWVYMSDHGNVWVPAIGISADWAPYRTGRWVLMGGDYVWISYEPWGWAPYHYGRWSYAVSVGWFWVPPRRGEVYWGPGYVGWVHTPTYVAWIPLAPGETYYGRGHYGPHSVNVTNINIQTTRVNIQKNVYVRNAVTIQHRDTFTRGRHTDFKLRENPFLHRQGKRIGMPEIKPEKNMFMPVIKKSPERVRPPEHVDRVRSGEKKDARPLIREHTGSTFRRDMSPRTMPLKVLKEQHEKSPRRIGQPRDFRVSPDKKDEKGARPADADQKPKEIQKPDSSRGSDNQGLQRSPFSEEQRKPSSTPFNRKWSDNRKRLIRPEASERPGSDNKKDYEQHPPEAGQISEKPMSSDDQTFRQRPPIKPVRYEGSKTNRQKLVPPSDKQDKDLQIKPEDRKKDSEPAVKEGPWRQRDSGRAVSPEKIQERPQDRKAEHDKKRVKSKDASKDKEPVTDAEQSDRDGKEIPKGFLPRTRQ